jgi:Lrp/AsnC family leucine-responsive transcriptional regulator
MRKAKRSACSVLHSSAIFHFRFAAMLDATDRALLQALLQDSRASLKALATQVGLSAPGVAERLRRLQERQAIARYTIEVNPAVLGYTLEAIVRIRPLPGKLQAVERLMAGIPELCECDKVTGEDCFIARLHLRSIGQLDDILARIADKAETNTSIVKSQVVRRRPPPLDLQQRAPADA